MARSSNTGRKSAAALAAVAIAAGALTAISGPASAVAPSADPPGVLAAKKAVAFLSVYPTKIAISVPLTKRPPKGAKVFYITRSDSQSLQSASGIQAATAALGWSTTILNFGANAADAVGLVQQAIQAGATYIATNGVDTKILQPGLDAARAANVPVFMNASDGVAAGSANWIFASVNNSTEWVYRGQIGAAQTVANSNGKANTLIFNVPQFGIYQIWVDGYKQNYAKYCPGCTINGELNVPLADVFSGKASSSIIAYLRSHPEVTQVACNNGSWCADVPAKASAAGINMSNSGIGLSGSGTAAVTLSTIVAGGMQSSVGSPLEYSGWQVVDAMARYSVKQSLVPNWKARLPLYLFTQKNTTATTQLYAGPTNYTGQFKKLWKVS